VRKADNLPSSCAVVTKSVNLNFLEPSGSVQACNRTVYIYIYLFIYLFIYILVARAHKRFLPRSELDRNYVFPDPYHVYQLQRDTSVS